MEKKDIQIEISRNQNKLIKKNQLIMKKIFIPNFENNV